MKARAVLCGALTASVIALAGCGGSTNDNAADTSAATVGTPTPTVTETQATTTQPKPKPKATTILIDVVGGLPKGGIARPRVKKNERVVIVVRSDTADELHLHGYDISRPIPAGGKARLAFVAKIPGRFELELEESGVPLADLTVR